VRANRILEKLIVQDPLPNSHVAWESAVAGIGRDAQIAASVQVSLLDDGVVNTIGSVSATRSIRTSVSINASAARQSGRGNRLREYGAR
jgi:hypothetical protein